MIRHVPMNPTQAGQAELLQNIVYSVNGQALSLLLPRRGEKPKRAPLIVFVQGSAWTTPNLGYALPMLSRYAEEGYAVATVSHRSCQDGHPFPAFLLDVKCALRFLRAHAEEYALDTEKIIAFGTSSGGNTVCLLGLTGDDPEFRTEEYPEESDAVACVVACFPPTDLPALFDYLKDIPNREETLRCYFGSDPARWMDEMRKYSPVFRIEDDRAYPPFLLLHGTGDPVVPHAQTEELFERLKSAHAEVSACYVDGAEHEGNFWSPEVRGVIHEAIVRMLSVR